MSCGNYTNQTTPFSSKDGGDNSGKTTQFDFATIKREILDGQCINCHTGRHKAYENYQVVKASAFAMLERIETSNPARLMPQGGPPLSAELKAMFKEWVEAGAPEFKDDDKKEPEPEPPGDEAGFAQIKEKVLKPYNCTACHSQYNDYASVYKDRGSIVALVSSDAMPFPKRKNLKADPVSDADKKILLDWVSKGAPEFGGKDPIEPKAEELKPTWISLRNNVFGPKCILCHNTFGNRGGGRNQSFDTYSKLRNWFTKNPELFNFKKKEGDPPGLFVESMERPICEPNDPLCFFSPMPFNNDNDDVQKTFERLTKEEIDMIKKWVELKLPFDEDDL